MKILVVGAGGFIGTNLCNEIAQNYRDWIVTAIDINLERIAHLKDDNNFNLIKADVLKDKDIIEQEIKKCDVVLPLAAIANPLTYVTNPLLIYELDFESNVFVVKMAAKYDKRVIFPSTSEVYGMCSDEEFDEESSNLVTGPINKQRWIYSCSKQMLDRIIFAYGECAGLRYTLFRPFNWTGPYLDNISNPNNGSSRVVTQFMSNILFKKDIQLVNGGAQRRCFTYISDGIGALIKIIQNDKDCAEHQIFNIGNPNNEISINDLAHQILNCAKNYPKIRENAENVQIVHITSDDYYGKSYQDVSRRVPAIHRAQNILHWQPKVSLDELLKRTMDFYFM